MVKWIKKRIGLSKKKGLYKELIKIIDPRIKFKWSDDNNGWLETEYNLKTGAVVKRKLKMPIQMDYKGIGRNLHLYFLLDMGFKYCNYCRYETFAFLHELGHAVNGMLDNDGYVLVNMALDNIEVPQYIVTKSYVETADEYFAWKWAYDFILKNKGYVKRLDKELQNATQKI